MNKKKGYQHLNMKELNKSEENNKKISITPAE